LLADHNVANALAAALAVHAAGVTPGQLGGGLWSFHGLPHRLEPVREVGGVLWINDSKATNIASTVVAVAALERPFVLLLGGRHKGEPYTRLAPLLKQRCRLVVAYGEAGPLVERDLAGAVALERGGDFADVAARGHRAAAARPAAAVHPGHLAHDQRRAPLGHPRLRDRAAVRARQVHGGAVGSDARGEEGRADPHLPARDPAVRRRARTDRRARIPRAEPVDGPLSGVAGGRRVVHGGGPDRPLPRARRGGRAAHVRGRGERPVPPGPRAHV